MSEQLGGVVPQPDCVAVKTQDVLDEQGGVADLGEIAARTEGAFVIDMRLGESSRNAAAMLCARCLSECSFYDVRENEVSGSAEVVSLPAISAFFSVSRVEDIECLLRQPVTDSL